MSDVRAPEEFVKRAATPIDTAARTYITTMGLASFHWAIKCMATGHWHYVTPDDALVEMWILGLLPGLHQGVAILRTLAAVVRALFFKWLKSQGIDINDSTSEGVP